MGLGDEIMALGRAERLHEKTGREVSILTMTGTPRRHETWIGNPSWVHKGGKKLVDGGGARPYIKFNGRQGVFNLEYKARAGRIYFDEGYFDNNIDGPYALINPHLKEGASPNKSFGFDRWAEVIKDFPIPVYQLCTNFHDEVLPGAKRLYTPILFDALAFISGAAVVMCNEGGTHHMAASMRTPAVVYFGGFIPPSVTGYQFHYNIAIENEHGYCGKWDSCKECEKIKNQIDPAMVREKAILMMESYNAE